MSIPKLSFRPGRSLLLAALSCGLLVAYTPPPTPLRVTSTFDGRTALPLRSKWVVRVALAPTDTGLVAGDIALPRDEVEAPEEVVESVTFLVDDQVRWVSRRKPYTYGGWAGYLVTSWLAPGKHTFTARVKTTDGRTAVNTVTASVVKPIAPPAALAGMWVRDIQTPEPEWRGKWNLVFDEVGGWVIDPVKTGVVEHISIQRDTIYVFNPIHMTRIEEGTRVPAYGAKSFHGHVCGDGGNSVLQVPLSTFRWAVKGDTLTVTHLKTENDCPDRAGLWAGTWTRVKNPPPRGPLTPVSAK